MSERRQGRGRLSSLELLPEEAQPDLLWLNQELRQGNRLQTELLDVFNGRLAALGIEPISKSAFSRYSVRKATQFRELDETRRISIELAEMLGTDSADKMTIAVAELLKLTSFKLLENGGLDPMDVMSIARAIKDTTTAQRQSAEYRRTLQRELAEEVEKAAADVAEIGKVSGITEETMRKITNRLKGIV